MKINSIFFITLFLITSCKTNGTTGTIESTKNDINQLLNTWHKAAADADYETYFNLLAENAVFVGTDSSEVWTKIDFENFSKPYFDNGKAWAFTPIKRHIYLNKYDDSISFDETLDTWMGVCRGSGLIEKINNTWLIKHYVLSITVPNDKVNEVIKVIKA